MPFRIPDLFNDYIRHQDVNDYLDYLQANYPKLVTVSVAGQSYEGRSLKIIRISAKELPEKSVATINHTSKLKKSTSYSRKRHSSAAPAPAIQRSQSAVLGPSHTRRCSTAFRIEKVQTKSVVLIDGGIHAREWVGVSTALFCVNQLVEHFEINRKLLLHHDFVIIPVVNIDGYEYSHTNNRMWRKTRRPNDGSHNIGTDCNRNFSFYWQRACNKPSKNTYRGDTPFSEPETRILKQLMHTLQPHFYLTLHSFAKSLMYPFGYTRKLPDNWKNMHELAKAGHSAIMKKTGTNYRVGNAANLIKQPTSGGSSDYALGVVRIPFVITMEISGGAFQPPSSDIKRLVQESWIGIKAMCLFINLKK